MKPLILLDVDGVLNPYHRPSSSRFRWRSHKCTCAGTTWDVLLTEGHGHGRLLLEFAAEVGGELTWATTWEHDANTQIGPKIGLPELPVIEVGSGPAAPFGVNPKVPAVAEYVAGRPFVWFDDDLTRADTKYLRGHPGVGAFRIVHVGFRIGLTHRHVDVARKWLAALPQSSECPARQGDEVAEHDTTGGTR